MAGSKARARAESTRDNAQANDDSSVKTEWFCVDCGTKDKRRRSKDPQRCGTCRRKHNPALKPMREYRGPPKERRTRRLDNWAKIINLFTQGKDAEEIAHELSVDTIVAVHTVKREVERFLVTWSKLNSGQNFVKYALFNMQLIRRLSEACDEFMGDKGAKQYNALVTSVRTQSELYDKIFQKGIDLGVIEHARVQPETVKPKKELLEALKDEQSKLSELIEELEVTTVKRTVKARTVVAQMKAGNDQPQVGPGTVVDATVIEDDLTGELDSERNTAKQSTGVGKSESGPKNDGR